MQALTDTFWRVALFAADAPPGTTSQPGDLLKMVVPLGLMFVVFYFLLIRPQQKKAREHQALVSALKVKDRIVTGGGLVGEVVSIKEKTVTVRCGEAKLEVLKHSISEVLERAQSEAKS